MVPKFLRKYLNKEILSNLVQKNLTKECQNLWKNLSKSVQYEKKVYKFNKTTKKFDKNLIWKKFDKNVTKCDKNWIKIWTKI